MKRSILVLAVAFALMTLRAFALGGQPLILPTDPTPLQIETAGGPVSLSIEIADDPSERARGLMFREHLDPDHGMLFVFERTGRQSFWMRNTPLPLDLIFISENGRVVAIQPGEPYSEMPISPIYPARFVLEVRRGTAAAMGITIGARVRHPALTLR